jgi:hypothetical protein
MHRSSLGPTALLVLLAGAACSTGPSNTGRLVFQFATTGTGASVSPMTLADVSVSRGNDVIVISQAQLVARRIKLKRVNGSCPIPDLSDAGDDDKGDSPECPNLRLGPLLLDPPLVDGARTAFSVDLQPGTYQEVELQIHKPTSSPADVAFVAANPGFVGISIKVTGTFNGAPFSFSTDITSEVEVEFETPVEVLVAGTTSITLLLDVRGWFLAGGGSALLSPLALTQQARQQVEQNIRRSFHAFEDEDHDGRKD